MRGTERVWTAPPVLLAAAFFLGELVWFVLNFPGRTGPPVLGAIPILAGSFAVTLAMRQAWTAPGLARPARRFWRTLTLASLAIAVVQLTDLPRIVDRPSIEPNAISLAVFATAMVAIVAAFYRLPLGTGTTGGRTRLLLDCAIVTLAALLVTWYVALSHQADDDSTAFLASTVIASVALALVVLALAKVVLSGGRTLDPLALRALGIGFLGETVGVFATPLFLDHPQISVEPLGRSAMIVLFAAAALYQRRAAQQPDSVRRGPRERTFSPLPYLAIAVVDAFLLYSIRGDAGPTLIIGAGSVGMTALVIIRQLASFRENARLIAEVRSYHDQLAHQATHDSLTGLANRALFHTEVTAAAASGCHLAIVDLDEFKAVNDTLGHHTGDGMLIAVADRLRASVRPGDLVARLGGDEFAVLLRGMPAGDVDEAVQRILTTLQQPLTIDGDQLAVRASIGVADSATTSDPVELMKRADLAMYRAKHGGKGQFARYDRPAVVGAADH